MNPDANYEAFQQSLKDLAAAHEASRDDPVPTCHFRPMTFHDSDSNPAYGGINAIFAGTLKESMRPGRRSKLEVLRPSSSRPQADLPVGLVAWQLAHRPGPRHSY